ncbi:MAG: cytochrome c3 family protein [Armatimonadota bacterium]|nr:cytochrome c3 family protein [Armatimonadota bacterium]
MVGRVRWAVLIGAAAWLWLAPPGRTAAAPAPPPPPAAPADSCTGCHRTLGGRLAAPTQAIADDIHVRRGFSCAACHGGDPQAPGMEAMDPRKGFVGKPGRQRLPALCGRCHADPAFMRRYNPATPTDEVARFLTSVHGQRLVKGDVKVATCTSCHGVHPILAVADSRSPVFPSNVPGTCARCHADARYMQPYGIPITQYAEYQASVHGEALLQRGSKQAPACNDCHGNHGAVPPGVESVANVCAQCHASQRDLFVRSPHRVPFEGMGLAQCTACHGTHKILRPTDEMVGAAPPAVCAQCHAPGSKGAAAATAIRSALEDLKQALQAATQVVALAEHAGMDMTDAKLPLNDAQTQLILARNLVHSLSLREVQSAATEGVGLARRAADLGLAALDEIAFRRRGLVVALVVIAVLVLGLYLKSRTLGVPGNS